MTRDELLTLADPEILDGLNALADRVTGRGDGVAVYENQDLGHGGLGHRQFVSFGSPAAQLEAPEAPALLPDIGGNINWRYTLVGSYREDKP